jgi:putative oxidoreductase
MQIPDVWVARTLSVLRIAAALFLLQHGTSKFLGFPNPMNPPQFSPSWFAGLMELIGGTMLALGPFTRPVAFLLSGMTAVAYFMVHAPLGFYPIANKGELAALYAFVFLYISVAGPGPWSLDAVIRGRSGRTRA